jgi:CBS domain-containing protein
MTTILTRRQRRRRTGGGRQIVMTASAALAGAGGYLIGRRRGGGGAGQEESAGGRRVSEAMTAMPRSVAPSASVSDAARLMRTEDVGSLPVVEDGRLTGMLTDRDIAMRVVAEGKDPMLTTVGEIASGDLVTVRPEQNLDEALRLMAQYQVRRLPVVEDDRLIGIVAQADVALEAERHRVGEVIGEVSQPTSTPRA